MDASAYVLLQGRARGSKERWRQAKTFDIPSHVEYLKGLFEREAGKPLEFRCKPAPIWGILKT